MTDTTFPAVDVRFDFKNSEWALAHLPNVRIATVLLQQDDVQLTEMIERIAEDSDCLVDMIEHLCDTKNHLEAIVELLATAIARTFIVADRIAIIGDLQGRTPPH